MFAQYVFHKVFEQYPTGRGGFNHADGSRGALVQAPQAATVTGV